MALSFGVSNHFPNFLLHFKIRPCEFVMNRRASRVLISLVAFFQVL